MWIVYEPEDSCIVACAIPTQRVTSIELVDDREDAEGDPETLRLIVTHDDVRHSLRSAIATGPADEMRVLFASLLSLTSRLDISTAVYVHLEGGAWRCERMPEPKSSRPPFAVTGTSPRRP